MTTPRGAASSAPTEHKFATLDALRGVAALLVVLVHSSHVYGAQILPGGDLRVDFFFLLSGFVLSYAYQQRLDSGWSPASFLRSRLIRIGPVYLLGSALGLLRYTATFVHAGLPAPGPRLLKYTLLALCPRCRLLHRLINSNHV